MDIRGRGCPLKLELTDTDMQNIDFGVTKGYTGAVRVTSTRSIRATVRGVCVCERERERETETEREREREREREKERETVRVLFFWLMGRFKD